MIGFPNVVEFQMNFRAIMQNADLTHLKQEQAVQHSGARLHEGTVFPFPTFFNHLYGGQQRFRMKSRNRAVLALGFVLLSLEQ